MGYWIKTPEAPFWCATKSRYAFAGSHSALSTLLMCGILFSLTTDQVDPHLWRTLQEINTKRGTLRISINNCKVDVFICKGPDSQQTQTIALSDTTLQFYSTVLHLRGRDNVPQPVCENGNILCWNGEIFDGLQVCALFVRVNMIFLTWHR